MKYLYIVEHFVPVPQSEYGGIWNVIAESDEECFDLITEQDRDMYVQFYPKLKENIMKAQRFGLSDDYDSYVVEEFTT